jgi:hypothetical protein
VTRGLGRAGARADATAFGVDRHHDGLRPQPLGELRHELWALERSRVDRNLVGACREQLVGVRETTDAAPDGERNRKSLGDTPHEPHERRTTLERRLDVEEDELVGAGVGVRGAELDRIADIAQLLEADALDDAPARDVEARDQTRERDRASSSTPDRYAAPAAPLFSGWNWQPIKEPERSSATSPSDQAVAHGDTAAYECAK